MENNKQNEIKDEIYEQKNFDDKVKTFFSDNKNKAITILSGILILLFLTYPSQSKNETISVSVEEEKQQVIELNKKIEELNSQIATLENNNKTFDKEKENIKTQLNTSKASIETLQGTIDEKDKYIDELEEKIETLEKENEKLEENSSSRTTSDTTSSTKSTSYTVYITNTGRKYHSGGCSYLKNSKQSIDKDDAISQGYTACSRCNP